jgi:hypothetical protein
VVIECGIGVMPAEVSATSNSRSVAAGGGGQACEWSYFLMSFALEVIGLIR